MQAEEIKGYQEIAEETNIDESIKLMKKDEDYIAANFPQVYRHFQEVFHRIHRAEELLEVIKDSFLTMNVTLQYIKHLTEKPENKNDLH